MKIRNGFVSNSSSSSFVIACKIKEKCKHCGSSPLDFFDLIHLKLNDNPKTYGYFVYDIESEIESSQFEIDDLEKDKSWIERKIKEYETLLGNKDYERIYNYVFPIVEEQAHEIAVIRNRMYNAGAIRNGDAKEKVPSVKERLESVRNLRQRFEWSGEKNMILESIESMKRDMSGVEKKIREERKYVEDLKKLDPKEWKLFTATIDNMDKLRDTVDSLEKTKDIEILKRVQS